MTDFAQRRFKCLAAVALAGLLAGCATSAHGPSGREELKTASDQTAAQKRAEIRLQLAIGYFEQANYPVALDEVKKAIAADPQGANGYSLRAIIYMRMGEKELANDNFLQGVVQALRCSAGQPQLPFAGGRHEQCGQLRAEAQRHRPGREIPAAGLEADA
jgi:type IV pilus assembly protein PilF